MSDPSQELDFTFDLGDPGEPVESLGELLSAVAEDDDELSEARESARLFGMNMPEDPDELGGDTLRRNSEAVTIESRPTGSGQVITKVEEREPTEEEIAEAFNKLSPGQQANYRARPWLWAPGAIGHPGVKKVKPAAASKGRKANRVNVRDIVDNICGESGLDPFAVMAHLMLNTDESRLKLGLQEKDKVSTMLRAKCAMELAAYMSPKLKSIEVKDNKEKPAQVQVFLPANGREDGKQAILRLPVKDGVEVDMSPETAAQMIRDGLVDVPDDAVEE